MSDPTQNWLIRWRWAIAAIFGLFAIAFVAYGDWVRATVALAAAIAFPLVVGSEWQRRRVERRQQRSPDRKPPPPKR